MIHVVQQGEHLSGIAKKYGFTSFVVIWEDPANADLKRARANPNVLFPGDRLVIPDRMMRVESRPTDQRHRFRLQRRGLDLRLALRDESGDPIRGTKCRLVIEGAQRELVTNTDGLVASEIPVDARHGRLLVEDREVPLFVDAPVSVGELDPADKVTGQIARLNNLGYDAGEVQTPRDKKAQEQFRSAVEEFQCNHHLVVDGVVGPATQASLKQIHGC